MLCNHDHIRWEKVEKLHLPRLIEIAQQFREDDFESRFFDRQTSYRYLWRAEDGCTFESGVYKHYLKGQPEGIAIEISCMVGCPIGCKFCASSCIPYVRALSSREMVAQFAQLAKLHELSTFSKVTCAFMGIGESSLIPNQILEAIALVAVVEPRVKVSIATTGARIGALKRFRESMFPIDNLQISFCGTTQEQMRFMMPASPQLCNLLGEGVLCMEAGNFSRVRFNYILIRDFNDMDEDVSRLAALFRNLPFSIKISALNPTPAFEKYKLYPSSRERAEMICTQLQAQGVDCFVFGAFKPIDVSCGQLTFSTTMVSNDPEVS